MQRRDGRAPGELRPIRITPGFQDHPLGSVLIETGRTRVAVGVWMEEGARSWLAGTGKGWVTAEYALLPGSTHTRTPRESSGKVGGRSQEIQRLVGRALRAAVDLPSLGERVLRVDCDVLQADGGTRTASITGGFVALALACRRLVQDGVLRRNPILRPVAAMSAGIVEGQFLLDLDYEEDHRADADLNFAFAGDGNALVEVQGTAERRPFSPEDLHRLLDLARGGVEQVFALQRQVLGGSLP